MFVPRPSQRLYYGWVLVGVLSLTETISWGILYYSFTVFLAPMQAELGWSRVAMTGAFSLALLLSGLAAIPFGRWLDRHGPRLLMTFGSCAAALLVFAWAAVDDLATFYLIWAGIGVTMAAVLYEPAFVVIATWFERKRGRALTILTFIGGFASVIFIPLADWLVRTQGWRGALVALASIMAVGTIPLHALVLRQHPRQIGLAPDGAAWDSGRPAGAQLERSVPMGTALRGMAFWYLTAAFSLATLSAVAVTVHLIPYLIERGYGSSYAAATTGLIGALALPGRLIFTPLGGRVPRRMVSAAIFLFQTLGLLVLALLPTSAGVLLFVVLFGAGFGAITPARAALVAELYGPAQYGSINSVLALFVTGARALAPVGAGVLYAGFGGYGPVLWTLALLSAGASALVLLVGDGARAAAGLQPMVER